MQNPLISKDIFSIGEFKKHASRLLRQVSEEKRPVIVTQNGTPVGVVVPPEEYDKMIEKERFLASVEKGLNDIESNRVVSNDEAKKILEKYVKP